MTTPTANDTHRAYMRENHGTYPIAVIYSGNTYIKHETVGTPEYFTTDRDNWLAGVRAVQLVNDGKATAITVRSQS